MNPELVFPASMSVYDQMRKTDGQVRAVLSAMTLLIQGTKWKLAGENVNEKVLEFVAAELDLQDDKDRNERRPGSLFNWNDFLRQALTFGPFGFSLFERVYEVDTDGIDPFTGLSVVAHLNRLSLRPQRTIGELVVNPDGSLAGAKQWVVRKSADGYAKNVLVNIPATKLVVFCADREGGDWYGQSWLRAAWFDWMLKTQIKKHNAVGIDRNSVGIPKVKYTDGQKAEALRMARQIRAGEDAGIAISEDWDVELMGVSGSLRDPLPSIHMHNQEIGRSLLAMVLNLGHDRGSQSLGETDWKIFCKSLTAICNYVANVVTQSVVKELVAINFGEDEPFPSLVADEIVPDSILTPEQLVAVTSAGIITADEPLEVDRRRRYGLPPMEPGTRENAAKEAAELAQPVALPDKPKLQGTPMAASHASSLDDFEDDATELLQRIRDRKKAEAAA